MTINEICATAYKNSVAAGWYHDPKTGQPLDRNKGEMLALMHSEISEAMEGAETGALDDHLPKRAMFEVELADLLIRAGDYAEHRGFNIEATIADLKRVETNGLRARIFRNLCLLHAHVSGALEGLRKDTDSTAIQGRSAEEVAIARLFRDTIAFADMQGLDLFDAIDEKMEYNKHRADHKMENRAKDGGKAF